MKTGRELIFACITLVFTVFLIGMTINLVAKYSTYEQELNVDIEKHDFIENEKTFDLLLESAHYNMTKERYEEALTDYKLALTIHPEDSVIMEKIHLCKERMH